MSDMEPKTRSKPRGFHIAISPSPQARRSSANTSGPSRGGASYGASLGSSSAIIKREIPMSDMRRMVGRRFGFDLPTTHRPIERFGSSPTSIGSTCGTTDKPADTTSTSVDRVRAGTRALRATYGPYGGSATTSMVRNNRW
jgi:hypothetical protein